MPTYVYRCDACSHQFELFQRMSDDPLDTCPECEGSVRQVIHPVGVVFKGSGWYINDSRSKSSTDGSGDSSSSGDASAKSDSSSTSDSAKTAAD